MNKKFGVVTIAVFIMAMLMTACSSTPGYKGVYEGNVDERPLEVPPDLTQPDIKAGMRLPQLASQQGNLKVSGGLLASNQYGKARLVRESSMRWLEVAAPIDEVWGSAQYFFRGLGFKLVKEDKTLGILETDWLENRVDVPTNWLSQLIKRLYDAGLLDSYRIRLEPAADKKSTLVFIAHRGMKEVYEDEQGGTARTKGWEVRESDAELETEMLQRFAIYLGGNKEDLQQQAKQIAEQAEFASVVLQDGVVALRLDESFARGWRRVGLGLDRMGVLVEDRNRSNGVYYVSIAEELLKEEEGMFAKLFASKDTKLQSQFMLRLIENNNQTFVAVFDRQAQGIDSKLADRILNQLKSHLN